MAAQASEPSPRAISSGRCPAGSGCGGWSVRSARGAGSPGAPRLRRQAQVPARPQLIRINEARAAPHVAAQIERGERRPVRAVAQAILRDLPEAVAGPDHVGRCGCLRRGRWRANRERAGDRGARRVTGRGAGPGAGREREGSADGRQREHAERDAGRQAIHERRTPETPTSPLRTCASPPGSAACNRRPRPPRPPGPGGTAGRVAAAARRVRARRPVDCPRRGAARPVRR